MRAVDIIAALREHHAPHKGWATVAEVTVATGFRSDILPPQLRGRGSQRIDFFALGCWSSTGYERVAYEVKVSRSDLLRELADPSKRLAAEYLANRFLFATPSGLMKRGELPDGCGLIEVREDGSVYTFRKGDHRDRDPLPAPFIASLVRCAADQRSIDNRCGIARCKRTAKAWRAIGNEHNWSTPRVPLCGEHDAAWAQSEAA